MSRSTVAYELQTVALHEVRPGSLVEHDGRVYKVFRRMRLVKPGGWILVGVARNFDGSHNGESVGLLYHHQNAPVQLVVS